MNIGLISAPPIKTKKKQDRIFPFAASLNYGLLSLATHLENKGFSASVFDPGEWHGGSAVGPTLEWIEKNQPTYIGISCISGFSYPSLKILSREIKKQFPNIPIIAGGKDHLSHIAKNALIECPEIDVIVQGEGELPLITILEKGFSVLNTENLKNIPNVFYRGTGLKEIANPQSNLLGIDSFLPLNFTLYENYNLHPPCIEVGRGCPYQCTFCSNDRHKILKKEPRIIVQEAEKLTSLYDTKVLLLYFQTPMFLMTDKELIQLRDLRKTRDLSFKWRTQTRVDYLSSEKIRLISQAGGRVIDLGLESGSEEMLVAMNKTPNPAKYLSKASQVLHAAPNFGIKIKLNILFFAGERRKTLLETFSFLENHSHLGWTLSAYPLLVYPGTSLENLIDPILKKHGGSKVRTDEWKERYLIPINPSHEFSYEELQRIGVLFGKAFQTSEEYFNERRYGYYKPNISYDDFLKHQGSIDFNDLPCSLDKVDMYQNRQNLKTILEGDHANCINWS